MTTIKPALESAGRAALAARVEERLRAAGAVRSGHARLDDARHADTWFEPLRLLGDPAATAELCAAWALEAAGQVDAVAGCGLAGAILAFETARQLRVRAAVGANPEAVGSAAGDAGPVLLVDDLLVDGASLARTVAALEAAGAEVVGCRVVIDASGEERSMVASPHGGRRYPLRALWRPRLTTWAASGGRCAACATNEPRRTVDA